MKKALFAVLSLVVAVSQFGCDLGSLVPILSVGGDASLILEALNIVNGW